MFTALNTADRGLRSAKFFGCFGHRQVHLGTPFQQIHVANIRKAYDASSVFYSFGVLAPKMAVSHRSGMVKKTKKRRKTFIKEWRKFRDLNQEELGGKVQLAQATIARIERGDIAYTQPVLEALAEALQCSPADLIDHPPGITDRLYDSLLGMSDEAQQRALAVVEALKNTERQRS